MLVRVRARGRYEGCTWGEQGGAMFMLVDEEFFGLFLTLCR